MNTRRTAPTLALILTCSAAVLAASTGAWRPIVPARAARAEVITSRWVTGDLHTHTFITDGTVSHADVASHAFRDFGLDYLANSDHGGRTSRDARRRLLDPPIWRWRSLAEHSFPKVSALRRSYPGRMFIQGLEWNVPGGDHASVGIVSSEPTAIAEFEYRFDRRDLDTSRGDLVKRNQGHSSAKVAVGWLKTNFPDTSYVVVNHPNRILQFPVDQIRSLNDAAPDIVFGLEGIPGRQRKAARGGYHGDFGGKTSTARTWGGADYTVARVGGTWDSLLGEGRHLWLFGNSDFHGPSTDFWPGEYTKTYTHVAEPGYQGLIDGMRSGDSFTVTGGLVNAVQVTLSSAEGTATLGGTLPVRPGEGVTVTVRFRVPQHTSGGRHPALHHIDVIRADTHARAQFGTPGYSSTRNSTARIDKRFVRSAPWRGWRPGGTWYQVSYTMRGVDHDGYVRLRGTNLAPGTRGQTDRSGNPLVDPSGKNTGAVAWSDCWLYSNPVFFDVAD